MMPTPSLWMDWISWFTLSALGGLSTSLFTWISGLAGCGLIWGLSVRIESDGQIERFDRWRQDGG